MIVDDKGSDDIVYCTLSKDDIANDNCSNMSQSALFQSLETCKMYQDADGSMMTTAMVMLLLSYYYSGDTLEAYIGDNVDTSMTLDTFK